MPCAGGGNIAYDGIGSQRKPAHGARLQPALADQVENGQAGEPAALSCKSGRAAIDVIVAGSP